MNTQPEPVLAKAVGARKHSQLELIESYDNQQFTDMAAAIADLLAIGHAADECATKTIPDASMAIWMLLQLAKKGENA